MNAIMVSEQLHDFGTEKWCNPQGADGRTIVCVMSHACVSA